MNNFSRRENRNYIRKEYIFISSFFLFLSLPLEDISREESLVRLKISFSFLISIVEGERFACVTGSMPVLAEVWFTILRLPIGDSSGRWPPSQRNRLGARPDFRHGRAVSVLVGVLGRSLFAANPLLHLFSRRGGRYKPFRIAHDENLLSRFWIIQFWNI